MLCPPHTTARGRVESVGQRRDRDHVPELVDSHCLPYSKSIHLPPVCTSGVGTDQEVCAPVDCDDLVTILEPHPKDLQPGLTLAECEPCTPNFSSLVSGRKSFVILPISVLFTCSQDSSATCDLFALNVVRSWRVPVRQTPPEILS